MTDDIRALTARLVAEPDSLVFLPLGEALRQRRQLDAALVVAEGGVRRYPTLADAYDLGVEHLWMFDTGALKLDANVGRIDLDDRDDVDVWGLGGTYYVNDRLGFGTAYEQEDSDNTDLESWSLFAEWFVTENVALALAYTEQEDQDIDLETDAFMFRADVRF